LGLRFWFPSAVGFWLCRRSLFPSAIATADLAWDYIFIFFDPCAGRRLGASGFLLRLLFPAAIATAGLM
jgi:hypothetical protein